MDGKFTRRPGLKHARGSLGASELVERVMATQPGRVLGDLRPEPKPKPSADDTPWRSRWMVNAKDSADGNLYRKGEPIPEAEAVRQGLLEDEAKAAKRARPKRVPCDHCEGKGQVRQMKGHRPGCGCPGCRPCKVCGGKGYVEEAA